MLSNSSFSESGATSSNIFNVTAFNNAHTNGTGASFTIFNPFDSSAFTFGQGQTSDYSSVGRGRKMIMVHKSAEQITGVNFSTSSGSFDTTVSVYGIL